MKSSFAGVFFTVLLVFASSCNKMDSAQEDLSQEPLSLGGVDLDQGWVGEGCKRRFVDASYIGPESGFLCTWRRKEGERTRLRQERFRLNGRRILVTETILNKRGVVGEARIYGQGNRFYRVMQVYEPRHVGQAESLARDHSQLEIIDGGRIVCVYKSDEKAIVHQGKLWSVPGDAVLIRGRPCPEVETRLRGGPLTSGN